MVHCSCLVATTILWHSYHLTSTSTFPCINSSTSKCYIHYRYYYYSIIKKQLGFLDMRIQCTFMQCDLIFTHQIQVL